MNLGQLASDRTYLGIILKEPLYIPIGVCLMISCKCGHQEVARCMPTLNHSQLDVTWNWTVRSMFSLLALPAGPVTMECYINVSQIENMNSYVKWSSLCTMDIQYCDHPRVQTMLRTDRLTVHRIEERFTEWWTLSVWVSVTQCGNYF